MSLVLGSREVAMGPTVGYQGGGGGGDASPPAYVSKGHVQDRGLVGRSGFCLDCKESASSGSSSIGVGGESSGTSEEEEDGEDEVQSKFKGGLGSMGSLEESLPIKRGLSNFFSGKSKSFANLADVSSMKDLAKAESPFNKRRKILMERKNMPFKRAFYSPLNASLPNLALEEDTEEEEEEEEKSKDSSLAPLPIQGRKIKCFKSPRSFSFTDISDETID